MNFIKAETNGNDFIIINKTDINHIDIQKISNRKKSIGADQVIIFEQINKGFSVTFFNRDGSTAEMCGNGLCALSKYIGQPQTSYLIGGRTYTALVDKKTGAVSINVPLPKEIFVDKNFKIIDTGNKHIVCLEKSNEFLKKIDEFNIHFIKTTDKNSIQMETFERGVGETLACGSGAIAAAFAYGNRMEITSIYHKGGKASVSFSENFATLSTHPNIIFEGQLLT